MTTNHNIFTENTHKRFKKILIHVGIAILCFAILFDTTYIVRDRIMLIL